MNSSIGEIYNTIKNHCNNNINVAYDDIFTYLYVNELKHKYENNINKLLYCLKTLQNIDINYNINFNIIFPVDEGIC